MDLQLYARVIWRFKLLVAFGLVLASALTLLSIVRVDLGSGVTYREQEQWTSFARLFVTQQGFPEGRSVVPTDVAGAPSTASNDPPFADPSRFTDLAVLYAQLATSDQVKRIMRRDGPVRGLIQANPVLGLNNTGNPLPMIDIAATATSRAAAVSLGQREIAALRTYLMAQQQANRIPQDERVVFQIVKQPVTAQLVQGRSAVRPLVVFLTVMIAVIALAFVLENLRPRARPFAAETVPTVSDRRSA